MSALLLAAMLSALSGCATAPLTARDRDEARSQGAQDRNRMDADARAQRQVDDESARFGQK
jgi:hypothetical protein